MRGEGSILGSMVGALVMAFLRNGSQQMGWPNYIQEIIIGAIIVTIIDDLTRDYYQYRMAMFGSVIVLTVMFMPRGIGGFIDDFLVRRRFKAIRGMGSLAAMKAGSAASARAISTRRRSPCSAWSASMRHFGHPVPRI